ncbi:transcription intermediary factor 1-alpha-like [Amphiura filiformis]|uniref:transcription intermediary factor 1-alpha-like n=1 Tax=Amphiura filiformis TaxID=82378 RepID=UPI003B2131E3
MTDSEPANPEPTLIHCGICSAVVDKPKLLPCLHTFCLKCLLNWSETAAEKNPIYAKAISCPNCHEDYPLPEGGVKELQTNVFVDNLKERESIEKSLHEDVKMSCTSCEDDNQAVGHCVDCGDFLCETCLQSHKRLRRFKAHNVSLLGELSGASFTFQRQRVCPKHVGEVLKFYCETCEEPICRDCVVIEHPGPDHKQIDIDKALRKRKTHLETLHQQSEDIAEAIDAAISEDERLIVALDTNVKQVLDHFKKTVKLAETEFLQKTQEFQASRRLKIESHKETLHNHKSRVCAALEMSSEVIQMEKGKDLGIMYAPLCKAMTTLNDLRPKALRPSICDVDFIPNKDLTKGLGFISGYKHWKLVKIIQSDSWGLKNPKGITYHTCGDLIVAVHSKSGYNRGVTW